MKHAQSNKENNSSSFSIWKLVIKSIQQMSDGLMLDHTCLAKSCSHTAMEQYIQFIWLWLPRTQLKCSDTGYVWPQHTLPCEPELSRIEPGIWPVVLKILWYYTTTALWYLICNVLWYSIRVDLHQYVAQWLYKKCIFF